MSIREDYANSLIKCFDVNDLDSAGKLIRDFHIINEEPDALCLYLESAYYYYSGKYALALYYADMCIMKDRMYEPVHELIGYLTGFNGDYVDYKPTFTKDVSSYHKPLKLLSYVGYIPIVDYTVELFKNILEDLGHTVEIIDIRTMDNSPLNSSFLDDIDLIYEFNNMGITFKDDSGKEVTEVRNIPIYSYMFDSPMFFINDFLNYTPNMTAILPDRNHEKYVKRFYSKVRDSFFVPLGSEEKPQDAIPFSERSIGCIYLGSLKEAPANLEDDFSRALFEFQKEHTELTTEDAIETFYKSLSDQEYARLLPKIADIYPQKRTDESFLLSLNSCYCFADLKINSLFRKRLVEVLVENGIDVEVYGKGWEDEKLLSNPHFKFGGLIPQDECIKKMQNSKFILNSMPWFKDGTHDRIYNAMLAKGLCVTDKSKYLCEEFTDGEDIVFYDLNDMDRLPEIIRFYEAHPELADKIIDAAYDKTVLKHSWVNRVIEILDHFFYTD